MTNIGMMQNESGKMLTLIKISKTGNMLMCQDVYTNYRGQTYYNNKKATYKMQNKLTTQFGKVLQVTKLSNSNA